MKQVLIVVDMQNDFVSGALGSDAARAIEPAVVEKILGFDGPIYFTLDTHEQDYSQTQEGKRLPVPHCIAGTEGWTPTAAVWMALMEKNMADEAHMVVKGTFGAKDLPFRLYEDLGRISTRSRSSGFARTSASSATLCCSRHSFRRRALS